MAHGKYHFVNMATNQKTPVSLSTSLLDELSAHDKGRNISELIERALAYYIFELKRREQGQRDIDLINSNSGRFNKDAEENLEFQAMM